MQQTEPSSVPLHPHSGCFLLHLRKAAPVAGGAPAHGQWSRARARWISRPRPVEPRPKELPPVGGGVKRGRLVFVGKQRPGNLRFSFDLEDLLRARRISRSAARDEREVAMKRRKALSAGFTCFPTPLTRFVI